MGPLITMGCTIPPMIFSVCNVSMFVCVCDLKCLTAPSYYSPQWVVVIQVSLMNETDEIKISYILHLPLRYDN